jgi:glycosyltransferase involved in cell wall biosynthesis
MNLRDILFSLLFFYKEKLLFLSWIRNLKKYPLSTNNETGVNLAGYLNAESGLGTASRAVARVLEKTDIPFALINIKQQWLRSNDKTYSHLLNHDNPYFINILHVNADMVPHVANRLGARWFRGKYNIGYWYWELDKFPIQWAVSLRCFQEIWVASSFTLDAVSKIADIPVIKMPPSVAVNLSAKFERSYFSLHENSFIFLYVFDFMSLFERKNPLAVISAFREAFAGGRREDVTLVLKLMNAAKNKNAFAIMLKATDGLPVHIIDSYLSQDELNGLISLSDCYISLHRAEGFGLPIAEAMYLGKPVIATAYSGNMEFMNEHNSLPVRYDMKEIDKTIGPYKKGNRWAEPDIRHASQLMTEVFEDRVEASVIGASASAYIKQNFSTEALAFLMKQRIMEIKQSHFV